MLQRVEPSPHRPLPKKHSLLRKGRLRNLIQKREVRMKNKRNKEGQSVNPQSMMMLMEGIRESSRKDRRKRKRKGISSLSWMPVILRTTVQALNS
jgi:hypothetical protein